MSFEQYWTDWLTARKADLAPGSWRDYERHGRLRILPALGATAVAELGPRQLKRFADGLADRVAREELAARRAEGLVASVRCR